MFELAAFEDFLYAPYKFDAYWLLFNLGYFYISTKSTNLNFQELPQSIESICDKMLNINRESAEAKCVRIDQFRVFWMNL